jgi:hypothetical protein
MAWEGHLLDVGGVGIAAVGPGIDDPHDDAADEQGDGHGGDAAQVLLAPLVQQQGGHGGEGEGDEGERDGVVEPGAVAVFAAGKGADELDDAAEEEQGQGEDGAELDDDGVHLPVPVCASSSGRLGSCMRRLRQCANAPWS